MYSCVGNTLHRSVVFKGRPPMGSTLASVDAYYAMVLFNAESSCSRGIKMERL